MNSPRLRTKFAVIAILLVGPMSAHAQESDSPSAVSALQARQGQAAYMKNCSACHGGDLAGFDLAPALVGDRFDEVWRGKTAQALADSIQLMPIDPVGEPGSLSEETYASILAFILKSNGIPAEGKAEAMDLATLASIQIPAAEGATEKDETGSIALAPNESALLGALPPVTDAMLRDPSPDDWLHWGGDWDATNFSPLDEITRENVGDLEPAWNLPLRGGVSNPMPLVNHGVMFLNTFPDTVLAIDAAKGALLWRYEYATTHVASQKMGLALHGDRVFAPTSDLHVIALSAKTGELIWDHRITPDTPEKVRRRYQLRSAPLVAGKVVIQGVTASSAPKGGFILGLDIETSEEVWRFNTIPRPGEPNGNTWNELPLEGRSGGSVWHQGSYDPELNLVYYGIAPTYDTGPLLHDLGKEGVSNEALYTNCTVAINPDTGELVWYYQHMPNDQWDLDWVFERQIVEVSIDGIQRKIVMNMGKMAILEALDAATGEYLFSVDTGVQNVITAIDSKSGAKTIDPEKIPDPSVTKLICPSALGARSWPQTAYSPRTRMLYAPLMEWCMNMGPGGFKLLSSGAGISSAAHPDALRDSKMGRIQAIDLERQELAWTTHQATPPTTGMLATGGGLVFSGDIDPSLKAFNDEIGELLWETGLGDLPSSSLITYAIDGRQYIAVVVGMKNFHVRDLYNSYMAFRSQSDAPAIDLPGGGPAIQVFALKGAGS